jgi:hypothetical protein
LICQAVELLGDGLTGDGLMDAPALERLGRSAFEEQ